MTQKGLRLLHWVVKTPDRTELFDFLHTVLGMHALRHEEFQEGCDAQCNGPYSGRWSKTMTGFGPEDDSFVLEVTYNYDVKKYVYGNDLAYIKIKSRSCFATVSDQKRGEEVEFNVLEVTSPEGFSFHVLAEDPAPDVGPIASICLNVTDLNKSLGFWVDTVGLLEVDRGDAPTPFAALSCSTPSATLRLRQLPQGEALQRGTGYGRLALSCPAERLPELQENFTAAGYKVLTPLITLDTPGKASVQVVIVADPDGHEVCFVGDEAFRELSQVDEEAPQLLGESIAKDNSKDWFAKKAAVGPAHEDKK